jgi:intein/homing endonuclease
MLKKGDKLLMLRKNHKDFFYSEIVSIKEIAIDPKEELFKIEVEPHHNFFAGRIIAHNDSSIKITAYFFGKDKSY